ncbi:NAD(+) synthase [Alistipes indistinctus]|jgi:NAD+ synthetase|uniref:Glutamine-dependent NAD(+) synthetase n=2 Tax=Alistipes indistinctus TaxID=626932 RepID=G5H9U2_9BACT|nr:NAD(+) synthase [Alistipes indistinctus]EHB91358.1 hypothetical protein HMPREF9450_01407 [Alistipes indistinctus YIT 12060]UWN60159.1 NAD(+) synthase [Alistipes indistinctus YIT 12060]
MNFGFVRIAAATPVVQVADCQHNVSHIATLVRQAASQGAAIVAFPELSITGYTCGDLFTQPFLLQQAEAALTQLLEETAPLPLLCIAGLPVALDNRLYNTAVVFSRGQILGAVPKSYLPNYNEFYENRWFAPGTESHAERISLCGQETPFSTRLLFECGDVCLGVEICEDLWVPVPPSSMQALAGANLLVNISASNEMVGKHAYLRSLIEQQSARTMAAYLYSSAGCGESTTDIVFAGNGIIAENGAILRESERFTFGEQLTLCDVDIERLMALRRKTNTFTSESPQKEYRRIRAGLPVQDYTRTPLLREISPYPFIPGKDAHIDERCEEIFNIQISGLAQRIRHTNCRSAVIGISGGLDSTLALLVAVRTFDKLGLPRTCVTGITMPGFGTTGRTYNNALRLMETLGITIREVNIRAACEQHFSDIGLDPGDRSVTYENAQARERTQILMDIANQTGGLVIGTGDLSELALGWATYNGDHMSMYGVNCGIPKTLVRHLVGWVAAKGPDEAARPWLLDILDTPISPELLPADGNGQIAQCTEELVGPYDLHDFFLYYFVRFGFRPAKLYLMARQAFAGKYEDRTIKRWLITFLRRFFSQQFKRSALPDGPKVGSVSLSPRGDWRMPSDASCTMWLHEAENL